MTAKIHLRGPRLTLRRTLPGDAKPISRYRDLPEVARFQSWTRYDEATAARMIAGQAGLIPDTPGTWLQLVIVETALAAIVGDTAIHFREDDPAQVELGINLAPDHQRRGYAAETLGLVLDYVFGSLGKHRAVAITDAENEPAASLCRRLGFRQEGHFIEHVRFKGAYGSEYLFALLAREWRGLTQRLDQQG